MSFEEEIYSKMDLNKAPVQMISEQQQKINADNEEIKRYGRLWMYEGYFNEKNK